MEKGRVNSRYELEIDIVLYHLDGHTGTIRALIDTGCDADLVVSIAEVKLFGLSYVETAKMRQADDEFILADIYEGHVHWQGSKKYVNIVCMGKSVLVGTGLLRSYNMNIDFNIGGTIEIS